jgi:dTDP-4-dehydrorhamnose reductase
LFQLIGKGALILPKRVAVDFLYPEWLADLVIKLCPAVIINAAAYILVVQVEVESELAYRINAQAVAALAEPAKRVGALLVHFSTDYVFDGGSDRPWREDDWLAPLNIYG